MTYHLAFHHKPASYYRGVYFFVAAVVLFLDQASKTIVVRSISLFSNVPVIPHFFSITHVVNRGAAFSLFADSRSSFTTLALILFTTIVLAVLASILWRTPPRFQLQGFALSFIFGGALGNLIDRIASGSVVDFLAFDLGFYHWPDFNLADSFIVIGSALLIVEVFLPRPQPVPTLKQEETAKIDTSQLKQS